MAMRRKYRRTKLSAAESAELWERWKKGEGLHVIGQALGRGHTSIAGHIRPSGGIRPPARRRSSRVLTFAEREEISRGIVEGRSLRAIARALGRSPSTVSREIGRNGGLRRYRAEASDQRAWKQALRPKPCKLALENAAGSGHSSAYQGIGGSAVGTSGFRHGRKSARVFCNQSAVGVPTFVRYVMSNW
jgi:DNA-binding CsgD family transcriptional regulator